MRKLLTTAVGSRREVFPAFFANGDAALEMWSSFRRTLILPRCLDAFLCLCEVNFTDLLPLTTEPVV